MVIRSRAPVRISLAGGGTDVSPYTEEYGGCALNATIRRYAWATLELRKDKKIILESYDLKKRVVYPSRAAIKYDGNLDLLKAVYNAYTHIQQGLHLYLRSDVPPRSGLGGSAAAFVATIGVFNFLLREQRQSSYEIAELAYRLEREVLKVKGGRQDQYASTFGGVNFIEFRGLDFVRVNPMRLPDDYLLELEKHLVLVRLPEQRGSSHDVIDDQVRRMSQKRSSSLMAMHRTKSIAEEMKRLLLKGDFLRFGELLHVGWLEKKKFTPLISNSRIDALYTLARRSGAIGGKITGAGGGGHMLFFCKPNREQEVTACLERAGATTVDLQFDTDGLRVWTTDNPTC